MQQPTLPTPPPGVSTGDRVAVIAAHHTRLGLMTGPYRHALAVHTARHQLPGARERTAEWFRLCQLHTRDWFAPELTGHTGPERSVVTVAVATAVDPTRVDVLHHQHGLPAERIGTVLAFELTRLLRPT